MRSCSDMDEIETRSAVEACKSNMLRGKDDHH